VIIEARDIKRSFRSNKKNEGFAAAIKLLVNPEYQTHEALKGVSFSIEEGSFNGLIGANGAGKTTLLKILSGLIPPTSGTASVLGYDPFRRELAFRKQIALVMGQKAQLWWDLPGLDAFDLLRAIYEIPEKIYRDRLAQLADILDVQKHLQTQIRRLSLGERMKMELIGALLHWPKVVFLDEPTIGLDVLAAHKLREFLKIFNHQEKATIILTSHNMDDIERLCSRVLILREGAMVYDGKPDGLTKRGERRLKLRIVENPALSDLSAVTSVPLGQLEMIEGDEGEESRSIYITLQEQEIVDVLQKIMARYKIASMGIEEQSLENVIQRLFADDKREARA